MTELEDLRQALALEQARSKSLAGTVARLNGELDELRAAARNLMEACDAIAESEDNGDGLRELTCRESEAREALRWILGVAS